MRIAETVTFGGGGLDRDANQRRDKAHLRTLLDGPNARVLPFWRGKPHLSLEGDAHSLAPLAPGALPLVQATEPPIYLGQASGTAWFAQDVSAWTPPEGEEPDPSQFLDPTQQHVPGTPDGQAFVELRSVMTRLTPLEAEIAATGKALTAWHATHRFCSRCGVESLPDEGGWQRVCPACDAKHFPRTDPVVIMLITKGNSVLVGRSPFWPERMYSLLAGFVEPGETLEAAVRREVMEEAGITVGPVGYLASQPWPFPASLMFGCWGEALNDDISIDPIELEDARWVTREEMLNVFAGNHPDMNPARPGAIAHFLIQAWLADRLD